MVLKCHREKLLKGNCPKLIWSKNRLKWIPQIWLLPGEYFVTPHWLDVRCLIELPNAKIVPNFGSFHTNTLDYYNEMVTFGIQWWQMFIFNYEAAILPIMFLQVAQTKCSVRNVNICLVLKTSITDMQVMFYIFNK